MAYLKLKEWLKAEDDATSALHINKSHIKSYQRRSSARFRLGKYRASLKDLEQALSFAKTNNNGIIPTAMKTTLHQEKKRVINALSSAVQKAPRKSIRIQIVERKTTSIDCDQAYNMITFVVPKTWCQFEATWKHIQDDERKADYLQNYVKPNLFPKLYKNGIEDSELLVDVISAASNTTFPKLYFHHIGMIPSLDMISLMLDNSLKQRVRAALSSCLSSEQFGSLSILL